MPHRLWHHTAGAVKHFAGRMTFGSRLHQVLMAGAGTVVAFHRINDDQVDCLTCSVRTFRAYCEFFRTYFDVVPLGVLLARLSLGTSVNGMLAITLDDGYADTFERAAPVLRRHGLPATVFIVSRFMSTPVVAPWDRELRQPPRWMTWDEVHTLRREGWDIGSHTLTHVDLGQVTGDLAWREIRDSRVELERELGVPVPHFAYPFGRRTQITPENRERVRAAGFNCCCSCFGGLNPPGADPFSLRRVAVSSWYHSPFDFGFDLTRQPRDRIVPEHATDGRLAA